MNRQKTLQCIFDKLFDAADKDHSQFLELDEVQQLLKNLDISIGPDLIIYLMHLIDSDDNGILDKKEFPIFVYVIDSAELDSFPSLFFYAIDNRFSGKINSGQIIKNRDKLLLFYSQAQADNIIEQFREENNIEHDVFVRILSGMSNNQKQ